MKILRYIFFLLALQACVKENDTPKNITSLSPNHGPNATTVIITGEGFSKTASNNRVFFNGHEAIVVSANENQITAIVPKLAGSGKVTVQVNSTTIEGPLFTYDTVAFVSTIAGNGTAGYINGNGNAASFNKPRGIAVDNDGNMYVSDNYNYVIRKITPAGVVSTFAGTGTIGDADGPLTSAKFDDVRGLTFNTDGNLYIADLHGEKIRKIDMKTGMVSTFVDVFDIPDGTGPGGIALFFTPNDITSDGLGNLYVSDVNNRMIRRISPAGNVTTIAGNTAFGWNDGPGGLASFYYPSGITVDKNENIFVIDGPGLVRKIDKSGYVSTIAGFSSIGNDDGTGTLARFNNPTDIVAGIDGALYIADMGNSRIRKVTQAGKVSTFAGWGIGDVDGPFPVSSFRSPFCITTDRTGTLYVADVASNKIRKIIIE